MHLPLKIILKICDQPTIEIFQRNAQNPRYIFFFQVDFCNDTWNQVLSFVPTHLPWKKISCMRKLVVGKVGFMFWVAQVSERINPRKRQFAKNIDLTYIYLASRGITLLLLSRLCWANKWQRFQINFRTLVNFDQVSKML